MDQKFYRLVTHHGNFFLIILNYCFFMFKETLLRMRVNTVKHAENEIDFNY